MIIGKMFILPKLKTTILVVTFSFFISGHSESSSKCSTRTGLAYKKNAKCKHKDEVQLNDVPATALTFETKAILINFNSEQEEKVNRATELIRKVIASKEFRDGILNHTWQGKKQFVDNKGFSNEEIYNLILEASESYNSDKNNSLDVELELYHETNTTIGYTFPHAKRIWMNKKYFEKYTPVQVSDNLFHEWLHKLGFDHATVWSKDRDYTVPYAIGYLVEKIAAQIEISGTSKPVPEKNISGLLASNDKENPGRQNEDQSSK